MPVAILILLRTSLPSFSKLQIHLKWFHNHKLPKDGIGCQIKDSQNFGAPHKGSYFQVVKECEI